MTPFGMIELAVKETIETGYAPADGRVGGDLAYDEIGIYVYIALVPGSSSSDEINGEWALDIDVFGTSYTQAMSAALDIEAMLLEKGGRHTTTVMRIDRTYQNSGPSERPWEDDDVFRIGATYVFTARRSG